MTNAREISVEYLARVEGEGSMRVKVVDDKIEDVEFSIFEPPRFFEAFMRGRPHTEAPDITARICGICPVAYQMSSVHAMEDAFGLTIGGSLRELRRLLYCGEWIESHALHIYLLHAPDFLGYESGIHMAADHREVVEQGLRLGDRLPVERQREIARGRQVEHVPSDRLRYHGDDLGAQVQIEFQNVPIICRVGRHKRLAAVIGQVDGERQSLCRITGEDEYQFAAGYIDIQILGIGLVCCHQRIDGRRFSNTDIAKIFELNKQLVGQQNVIIRVGIRRGACW